MNRLFDRKVAKKLCKTGIFAKFVNSLA